MATATYTCSVFKNNTPKFSPIGNIGVGGSVMWTATSTVGDIAFLAKVPHGAKIIDISERHSTGAAAQALSFGFDRGIAAGGAGNLSILISSGAQGAKNSWNFNGGPLQISLSDLDPVRYAILQAKVESGTTTTSLFIENFFLSYRFDGPDPH